MPTKQAMKMDSKDTMQDAAPSLPTELAHQVLLHIPAQLVLLGLPNYHPHISIARFVQWTCVLPPCASLHKSAVIHAAAMFPGGAHHMSWGSLFSTASPPAPAIIDFLINWYTWTNKNASHMYAAFDCALASNRVDVLQLWWDLDDAILPQRTGLKPQPELHLGLAIHMGAFDSVLQAHRRLMDVFERDCRQRRVISSMQSNAFDERMSGEYLIPLVRDFPQGSPQYDFFIEWVGVRGIKLYETGAFVVWACKHGRLDVLNSLAAGTCEGIEGLVKRLDKWDRQHVGTVAIQHEQWQVLKWWLDPFPGRSTGIGFAVFDGNAEPRY